MTEVGATLPLDPAQEMRGLMRSIHLSHYTGLEEMRQFMILYEAYPPEDRAENLYEILDAPDIGLEFWEGTFDDIVASYEKHGGSWTAVHFPETDRVPSSDWSEELSALNLLFDSDSLRHPQTHALYVITHAEELKQADNNGTSYKALLANPNFMSGLARIYDFAAIQEELEGTSDIPDPTDSFLKEVLNAVGYHYADNFQNYWQYGDKSRTVKGYAPNLLAIAELETARPGATKYLSSEYGIRHFCRYPTELLISQFDNCGKIDRPYGVIITAADDHNGAFSDERARTYTHPSKIYAQAKGTHDLLVAEAETASEFERRLKYFDAVNGHKHKIDFAFIEAHGSQNSLRFGATPELGKLAVAHKLRDVSRIFSKRASVVVAGCSSGLLNGVAQSLSRQFNTVVVAPQEKVGVKGISFVLGDGHIRLVPEFTETQNGETVTPVVYKNGSPLGVNKTTAYLSFN